MRGILILLVAGLCRAQQEEPPASKFPSDVSKPERSQGRELLEAVCPGKVTSDFHCKGACPGFTAFGGESDTGILQWSLDGVVQGHFLSPASDDAVLSMSGCEPHVANFGGSILLTRRSGKWEMLWYKAGIDTSQCHKTPLRTGRDLLVCLGGYGGMGTIWEDVRIQDLLAPAPDGETSRLIATVDNLFNCGENFADESKPEPLIRSWIDEVKFKPNGTMSVMVQYGKRIITRAQVRQCNNAQEQRKILFPAIKKYQIDFLFNGSGYKVAPWSAKTAAMVQAQH